MPCDAKPRTSFDLEMSLQTWEIGVMLKTYSAFFLKYERKTFRVSQYVMQDDGIHARVASLGTLSFILLAVCWIG